MNIPMVITIAQLAKDCIPPYTKYIAIVEKETNSKCGIEPLGDIARLGLISKKNKLSKKVISRILAI